VAACDAYDAITSDRCYRPARSAAVARNELVLEAGRQFDPVVVSAVLATLEEFGESPALSDSVLYEELLSGI
jgi:HD-GYP domain-containing protein (c-di-GMP phosphodiesterase class II)